MSVRLADRSFQYPLRIAENMLVEVGKFTFPADFVILEMEEDILTSSTKFLEEDFDALLDEGSKILHSIEGTILEEKLFAEFDEFMAMTADENSESESDTEEPPFKKMTFNTDYKIKTSIEEPPTDLKLKPLPENLEYVFLEEPSFLPVIYHLSFLKKKNKLIGESVLTIENSMKQLQKIIFLCRLWIKFEVFMDDFSIFGSSFDHCLNNLDKMIQRCKDAHLVLNWEKCHFMVKEGIVLGPKVSEAGLEVDKAKIDVFSKLPPPTNIKDRKGTENVTLDHLSQIENEETSDDSEVDDNFPRETLMEINTEDEPWFADFVNYLASDIIPKEMTYQQKKFFSQTSNTTSGRNLTSSKNYISNLENYGVCSKDNFHASYNSLCPGKYRSPLIIPII
ncbi:hypothetical protein Tco_0877709 [Tanacetum coccineum]|uniref:Reverse transcriptase domain-containing protein n=1 Tax=Tanacetum coccineum TaxID=301880 RepID=A0ABQ5BZ17_9ASTR